MIRPRIDERVTFPYIASIENGLQPFRSPPPP